MVVVPSRMGRLNKRALLAQLQRMGLASRADLAKALGMSQPTAGKIADELLALGVLEEADGQEAAGPAPTEAGAAVRGRLGRPGRMLRLNRSNARFIALQLGVHQTQLAALPVGADSEDHWAVAVDSPGSAAAWVQHLRRASSRIKCRGAWGVLVSVPGIVDEEAGRVLFSPNLHWTEQADLKALVRKVWNLPVVLVQEERALALGHQYVAPETEDFFLADFGEGVGGAIVVDGRLYEHPLPISGEFGHTQILGNERRCGCGATGCLETLVSIPGLLRSFAETSRRPDPNWFELRASLQEVGLKPWLREALDATAVVIAGALNVLGLRRVVITGSLTDLPPVACDYLSQGIKQGAMWARFGEVEVRTAPRRRIAGLVAVGLDRLVLPMAVRRQRPAASMARSPARL